MKKDLDVAALGEVLIDFTMAGTSGQNHMLFEANPGGAPCNVLAMLRKLDKHVAFIGKVGKDMFGDFLENTIRSKGILTDGLVKDTCIPTTLAFVHTAADGEREFSFYRNPGADMMLGKEEVDGELIKRSRIFHYGSLSMTHDKNYEATQYAIQVAKDNGCLISFDPNLRLSLWKTPEEARRRILYGMKQCDIMKISEEEVAFVSAQESLEEGVSFIRDNSDIKILFVTLGNKGSIAYYKDEKIYCGGIHQEHVVDTTGAGDTFCGAVLSRILELGTDALTEKDIREMLLFANAAASIVVTRKGALCSMPEPEEIRAASSLIDKVL